MLSPTWQSLITELVPRREFAAATRLDMVSVNVSRAAGPAIAGFVIATWGVPPVFALTAVTGAVLAVVLLAVAPPTSRRRARTVPAGAAVRRPLRPARAGGPDRSCCASPPSSSPPAPSGRCSR